MIGEAAGAGLRRLYHGPPGRVLRRGDRPAAGRQPRPDSAPGGVLRPHVVSCAVFTGLRQSAGIHQVLDEKPDSAPGGGHSVSGGGAHDSLPD